MRDVATIASASASVARGTILPRGTQLITQDRRDQLGEVVAEIIEATQPKAQLSARM